MKYKCNLIITLLLSIFFVSCSQSSQDLKIHIPYLDDNILEWQEYIPYENQEREVEGIWDEYILRSSEWYNCDNIQELGRFSFSLETSFSSGFSGELCEDWKVYKWHNIMYFVYYDTWFESLPKLWYKMLFFHPEKWYIDYIIPEKEWVFDYYADIQLDYINKKVLEWAEFPNEKWSELYDYMDTWFKKDFNHYVDGAWIRNQVFSLRDHIDKYLQYSLLNLPHSYLDYDCSNVFGVGYWLRIGDFRPDLCKMIEIGDRKLIYLLFMRGSNQETGYWITEDIYLIDKNLWFVSINPENFQLKDFLQASPERYDIFGSWVVSIYQEERLVGAEILDDSISWVDLHEVDDEYLKDIYLNSPEIEQEFLRLEEYVKENYITTNQ